MNVLMVNTAKERGGAARMAATLADVVSHDNADINAQLIHFEDTVKGDTHMGIKKPLVYPLLALQTRLLGSYRVYDFGVSKRILQYAKKSDIVHLHNLHGYYVDYVHLLNNISDKVIVWTWHDMWGATGRCGFPGECTRWEKVCAPCPQKKLYPTAWMDNSAREYDLKHRLFFELPKLQIVCPSQWIANVAVRRGFEEKQVSVIPNPVDTEVFNKVDRHQARKQLGLDVDDIIALFIADRCDDPRKGYPDFCEATLDSGYHAIAVGVLPANPAQHVTHTGRINSRTKLAHYYAAADVMVIPSHSDNYPNTVIESLVCGTPVIGYDEGGIASQLTHPFCAVTPKGQIALLKNALTNFLSTVDEARKYSITLAKESTLRWSKHTVAKQYCDLYRKMLTMHN